MISRERKEKGGGRKKMVSEDQSRYALVANDPISGIPCAHMKAGQVFFFLFFFCECTRPISLPLGPPARGNHASPCFLNRRAESRDSIFASLVSQLLSRFLSRAHSL